ncbi:MAG: site-specific integrase [Peptococcaceae bacterium]|nr:site-specific integrase [Peptococcaceae bacterium]
MKDKDLVQLANEFLDYKRSNSYVYKQGEYYLKKYVAFSKSRTPDENILTKESIEEFLGKYANTPGSLYNVVSVIREFGRYLVGRGYPDAYLIPAKKVGLPTPVQPYLFTSLEIASFFEECDKVKEDPHFRGRHLVLPTMYRLLYCCGLRCKEVRTLRCENVHLDKGHLDILQSKGPKSRRIFVAEELAEYLKDYDQKIKAFFPNRQTFFPNRQDRPYSADRLIKNFHRFWFNAFPEKEGCETSIRPYDLRHHFAYSNMNRWLSEGRDINVMLPYLMKYMGHSDVESTLYYFHLVPDVHGVIVEKSLPFESLIPEV